jgi:uncharacterized protein YndB with AHSA1/START domain
MRRAGSLVAILFCAGIAAGCASAATAARTDASVDAIEKAQHWPAWPTGSTPADCPVFVRNQFLVAAPPAEVWRWLERAEEWPTWFARASKVHFTEGGPSLAVGSKVEWRMLGATIRVTVRKSEPPRALDWEGGASGVHAYHAWLLEPTDGGTRIVTEETECGGLPSFLRFYLRSALHDAHQEWVESLGKVAKEKSGK